MVKRQFMPMTPLRDNGYNPEQASPSTEGLPADAQDRVPLSAPQARSLPLKPSSGLSGTGLLSGWKTAGSRYPYPVENRNVSSVAEKDTLIHQAIHNPQTAYPYERSGVATISPGQRPLSDLDTNPLLVTSPGQGTLQPLVPMHHPTANRIYPQPQSFIPRPGTTAAPVQQLAWDPHGLSPFIPAPMGVQVGLRKKKSMPTWVRAGLFAMLVFLLLGSSVAGYYYYTLSAPIGSIVNQQVPRLRGDNNPNQGRNAGGSILSGGRINILLLGSDTDVKFTNLDGSHTYLAQTDIVVSVDPATKNVTMLSIPRDFWVNVPGSGMHKLDEAYALGGIALSRLTISQDFGIHINYYAWVGLDGFVKVVNTVNGVDLDVTHPITDDNYPDDVGTNNNDIFKLKRLYLAPGPQHLDGPLALEYVRSRHADLVGDFGRSARQQQVLSQLKNKLNNPNTVSQLPQLANDLNGYVKTDMQLNDVFNLMYFARGIDTSKINHLTLGPPYSASIIAPGGKSIVAPNCALIVPALVKIFGSSADARCNITANSGTPSSLASASQGSFVPNTLTQTTSQLVNGSSMNLSGGNSDPSGIHSLLDLLFLVVFESPAAVQA